MSNILPQDNYDTYLTAALGTDDTTIYVGALPTKTSGYLVIYDVDGRTIKEKIKYTGTASSPNRLTGCTRGLAFSDTSGVVSDAEVPANKLSHPKNVRIAMTDNVHYLGRALSQLNGDEACGGVLKNPATRTISDARHLVDKEYADALAVSAVPQFAVTKNGADPTLTVNVGAGEYIAPDGSVNYFAGQSAVAVVNNATNYVETNNPWNPLSVSVNQSGFTMGSFPLAIVVASGGTITSITDRRAFLTSNDGAIDKVRTWATVQSFAADKLQITTEASSANDAVRQSYLKAEISKGYTTGIAGETIAVGQALYLKASDGKLYKAVGTGDETTYGFCGIAVSAGNSGDTIYFARPGDVATGLSGLTAGSYYFITDTAGTIGVTPGTRFAKIGQALSTTTLRVCEPKFVRRGTVTISATGDTNVTTGFYPAHIVICAGGGTSNPDAFSLGNDANTCITKGFYDSYDCNVYAWIIYNSGIKNRGTVSAKSATGFTLNCQYIAGGTSAVIQWTAFSE
jgi:hypothetical protein